MLAECDLSVKSQPIIKPTHHVFFHLFFTVSSMAEDFLVHSASAAGLSLKKVCCFGNLGLEGGTEPLTHAGEVLGVSVAEVGIQPSALLPLDGGFEYVVSVQSVSRREGQMNCA